MLVTLTYILLGQISGLTDSLFGHTDSRFMYDVKKR